MSTGRETEKEEERRLPRTSKETCRVSGDRVALFETLQVRTELRSYLLMMNFAVEVTPLEPRFAGEMDILFRMTWLPLIHLTSG